MDMNVRLNRLYESRARAYEALKAILEPAESESRSMTGEETGAFEKASNDLDAMDAEIRKLGEIIESGFANEEMRSRLGLDNEVKDNQPSKPADINVQLRQIASGELRSLDLSLPRDPRKAQVDEARSLLVGTTNAAGTITQPHFVLDFQSALIDRSSLLSIGPRIIQTTDANQMDWPRQLTRMGTAGRVAEGGTIGKPADPTFDRISLSARKYAGIAQISHEMIEDGEIDLTPLLVEELSGSVAWAFNTDLYTGTGSNMPYGLLTRVNASSSAVTGGAGAAPTFDNLIDLQHTLKPQFRANAFFITNDDTVRQLRKVKDTTGEYIYNLGTTGGVPDTILGKRFVVDTNMPVVAAGVTSVVYGDPSYYWVRQVRNVRLERSDEYAFDTDLVSFKCVFRGGADLTNYNAFVAYKSA